MLHTQYLEVEARPVCWTRVGCSLTHAVTGQGDQFDLTYDCPVQQCCFSLNLRIQVSWIDLDKYANLWLLVAFMVRFFACLGSNHHQHQMFGPSSILFFDLSEQMVFGSWRFSRSCMVRTVSLTGCVVKVWCLHWGHSDSSKGSGFALQRVHGCIDDHPHFDSSGLWPSSVRSRPCSSHCVLHLCLHAWASQLSQQTPSDNVYNDVVFFDARIGPGGFAMVYVWS